MVVHLAASVALAFVCATVFCLWYDRWPRRKLSAEETERFMARMHAGRPENRPEDLERFRRFQALAESDDGREFYMVNFIRYRKDGSPGDVPKSHADYMRAWGRVAIRRASHLIYRGKPALKLFGAPDDKSWDAVAIMRYRSRRDLLEIVTDPVFSKDSSLKNVSVEYTDVYPTSVAYIIASPRLLLFLVLIPLFFAIADWTF